MELKERTLNGVNIRTSGPDCTRTLHSLFQHTTNYVFTNCVVNISDTTSQEHVYHVNDTTRPDRWSGRMWALPDTKSSVYRHVTCWYETFAKTSSPRIYIQSSLLSSALSTTKLILTARKIKYPIILWKMMNKVWIVPKYNFNPMHFNVIV